MENAKIKKANIAKANHAAAPETHTQRKSLSRLSFTSEPITSIEKTEAG
jgi:hypothetical protein